jgi:hypothetical protein
MASLAGRGRTPEVDAMARYGAVVACSEEEQGNETGTGEERRRQKGGKEGIRVVPDSIWGLNGGGRCGFGGGDVSHGRRSRLLRDCRGRRQGTGLVVAMDFGIRMGLLGFFASPPFFFRLLLFFSLSLGILLGAKKERQREFRTRFQNRLQTF